MNYIFKGGILNSKSLQNLLKTQFLAPRAVKLLCISNFSSKLHKNAKKGGKKVDLDKHRELQCVDPLFDEILGIFGSERIEYDEYSPSVSSVMKETRFEENVRSKESSLCQLQYVCGNANEKKDLVKVETLLDEIEVVDVSSIVRNVIEIVRCESGLLSMEERLKNADFIYSEEVVVNVLKRCSKVPHLALRFFKWVGFGDGLRHTTNTFNVMIHVAGEAKELGVVEELVEEMEKSSCEKNVKTWTVLVSHYGNTKQIGKALK